MNTRALSLALALVSFGFQAPSAAQESAAPVPDGAVAERGDPAFVLYQGSLRDLLADPRDAGLLRALEMLGPRLTELVEEFGEAPFPPGLIDTGLELLMSAKGLRLGLGAGSEAPTPASMPAAILASLWGELEFRARDLPAARDLAARIERLLSARVPDPLPEVEGNPLLKVLEIDGFAAYLGSRPEADGSASVLVSWGEPNAQPIDVTNFGLPQGVDPHFALRIDFGALRPAIEMVLDAAGDEAEILRKQLTAVGMLGEDADSSYGVDFACGHGGGALHYITRQVNWVQLIKAMDGFVPESLSPAALRLIPGDATVASLAKVHFPSTLKALMSEVPEGKDPRALVKALIGVDLEEDIIDALGTTFGAYLSETTGGGGPASIILFLSVRDREVLGATMEQLASMANALGETQAQSYVAIRGWRHGDAECMTLGFPGLPVPLELSTGFHGGYLFFALTPGALIAALDHAGSGAAGLTAEPRFLRASMGSLADLQGLTFSDTPRMIRNGYGTVALSYSALANGLRSHQGAARDPGILMPSYHALMEGSLPHVAFNRIQGNDLVMSGRGDGSVTANLAGLIGNPIFGLLVVPLGVGIALAEKDKKQQSEAAATEQSEAF